MMSIRHRLKTGILLAALVAVASPALAQPLTLTTQLPFDAKVRTGKLPNGLTYYIRQNEYPKHRADFRLAVKAGSVLEDNDQQGLAHMNEHMAFNGTTHFPGTALPGFLESHGVRFGAHVNAYTSFDETVYRFTLPTDQPNVIDTGLYILNDWARNVVFDPKEIDKERGVVGEEWRLGLGAQQRILDEELPVILPGSRYAQRIIIGNKHTIDTAHYEAVQRFYKDWYRPDLMAVIVVGDVDPSVIEQKIKDVFGTLRNPAEERARTEYNVPAHAETAVAINSDSELTSTTFQYQFIRPETPVKTVGDYVKNLEGDLYDQMLNARLQELTTQSSNPPFVFAGAGDGNFLGHTKAYGVVAGLKQDSVLAGIRAVVTELDRVRQHGFTQTELDRAKKNMLANIDQSYAERSKTESDDYASEYQRNFLTAEPSPGIVYEHSIYTKYVPTITLAEVNALTAERIDNTSPFVTLAYPKSADIEVPTANELLSTIKSIAASNIPPYQDKVVAASLMTTSPREGKIVKDITIPELGVTEWILSNGAKVVIKPTDFKDDEILFKSMGAGGTSLASDPDLYSASFSAPLVMMGGVSNFSMLDLQKLLTGKEVEVTPAIGDLSEGLSGQSNKKDLETMFQLIYLYSTKPRLDSTVAEGLLTRVSSMLKNKGHDPNSVFRDTVTVTMAQHNPRAQPMSVEMLNRIKLNDAMAFYRQRFANAADFTYYFVGNVNPMTLKPLVERYIASLPSTGKLDSWRDVGIHPPTGIVKKVVLKGNEPKSTVRMTFTGPFEGTREERYAAHAMTEALQIKLREDLREDKSGVYGIGVNFSPEQYPTPHYALSIAFGCAPERVDELVAEVQKQIDTITSRMIAPTYVEKVKETEKRELETGMKENSFWLNSLSSLIWENEDPKLILSHENLINSLTSADILNAAKKYFNRDNYALFELLPEEKK